MIGTTVEKETFADASETQTNLHLVSLLVLIVLAIVANLKTAPSGYTLNRTVLQKNSMAYVFADREWNA